MTIINERCSNCQFWTPKFYETGLCGRQWQSHSKMFVMEGKDLITHALFHCQSYIKQLELKSDVL